MNRSRTVRNGVILAAFTAFCVAVLEFLAVNIGQPNPLSSNYTVHAVFSNADGIPTAADVRVAGVVVGKVTGISHDPRNPGYTVVTLQIGDSRAVPIYSNGFATVRPKTLLGEKYIDLTVGSRGATEAIPSGGYLPAASTAKDVSSDEIFNAFDAPTRAQQQQVLAALDSALKGRSGDIRALLPQLSTVVSDLRPIARVYEKDQPQTDSIFVNLNTIMQTLADEQNQLAGLLGNGNVVLGAIAARDGALVGTLRAAGNVAAELNAAMAPEIAAQRASLDQLASTLDAQNAFLDQILGPHCNNNTTKCGIDEIFTGTVTGKIHYPDDQLNVTSATGERVTGQWDSMFSNPCAGSCTAGPQGSSCSAAGSCALNIDLSFHCDTISTMLQQLVDRLPPGTAKQVRDACTTATLHSMALPPGGGLGEAARLAGLLG